MLRLLSLTLILAGLGLSQIMPSPFLDAQPLQTEAVPRFEEKNCKEMFSFMEWKNLDLKRFTCGYLATWEDYEQPSSRTIRLPILWVKSKNSAQTSRAKPIIYLDGGPGATGFWPPNFALSVSDYYEREWIFFGQRGTRYAEPNLSCTEYRSAILGNWQKEWGWQEWNRAWEEASWQCLQRLSNSNSFEDITHFNSHFSAMDVLQIIEQLGYQDAVLYGTSYGTLLAQHVASLAPERVHGMILDGVVPLDIDLNARSTLTFQRSLNLIFQACAEDSACQKNYPDLEPFFYQLVDHLNQNPARIRVKDQNIQHENIYLDGYGFLNAVFSLLYEAEKIREFPQIIYSAGNGDFSKISPYYYFHERSNEFAWGMYFSVYCAEFSRFNSGGGEMTGISPQLQILYSADKDEVERTCPIYDPQNLAVSAVAIPENQIPVLIFSGKFDPITPPEYGEIAAESFPIHHIYTSPTGSHGSSFEECGMKMTKNFLANPVNPKAEACWDMDQKVKFKVDYWQIVIHRFTIWSQETWDKVKSFVQNQYDRIKKAWADFKEKSELFFKKQLEALKKRLLEEFERLILEELKKLILELCGFSIPINAAAFLLFRRLSGSSRYSMRNKRR